jgi:hypothetical protein
VTLSLSGAGASVVHHLCPGGALIQDHPGEDRAWILDQPLDVCTSNSYSRRSHSGALRSRGGGTIMEISRKFKWKC